MIGTSEWLGDNFLEGHFQIYFLTKLEECSYQEVANLYRAPFPL